MSASQIPNLNSLRQGFSRGRGRDGPITVNRESKDKIIQNTDNDASTLRLSAVEAGYLVDPFAKLLTSQEAQRRLPLMNRGTYIRTTGIDKVVETFLLSQPGRKQVISLGAGSDTRYFRLKKDEPELDVIYHEIDFEANTRMKIERLKAAASEYKQICNIDIDQETTGGNLKVGDYYIHARDLRNIENRLPGVNESLPTLFISECCLIYLSPEDAEAVLTKLVKPFKTTAIVIYEPIRPNDAFGRTMIRNLITRGIHLQTLEKYADLAQQQQRLQEHGFDARAVDIDTVWRKWISSAEKGRVEGLEWMDEVEEFVLLAKHYCISWGWKGFDNNIRWEELPTS